MRRLKTRAAVLVCAGAAFAVAAIPAQASAVGVSAAPSRARAAVVDCLQSPQIRPRDFLLACADGNNFLTSLRWTSWRSGSARGTGRDVANDCRPYCAAGHFHSYPVRVRLDHARPWKGHPHRWQYTRLTLHYTAAKPAFAPRVLTVPLWS
jgi:hypothetical protein